MRANILARKKGPSKGTVWVVAHMDVVPTGDPDLWDTPPFDPVYRDGKVYGRGTEDNGQSVISSIFASRACMDQELHGMSMGVALVADEETSSKAGIEYLLDHGYFSEDDVIYVPDWGTPGGTMVDVSEKHMLWVRVEVHGKTAHASNPDSGINAYRVSTCLLMDLLDKLERTFDDTDPMFSPSRSTFEPTKRPATVENINTIPGNDEFCMDIRLLPQHRPDDVMEVIRKVAAEHAERSGAEITVEEVMKEVSGKPSSLDTRGFEVLSDSVPLSAFLFRDEPCTDLCQYIAKGMDESSAKESFLKGSSIVIANEKAGKSFAETEEDVRKLSEELGVKLNGVFQPIRVAITNSTVSLPLHDSISLLGLEETERRIERAKALFTQED